MTGDPSPALRRRIENTIRFLAVDGVEAAKCGHPGAPMALAGAALEIFDRHLRFDPSDPAWPLRDRFVLSNGHASMLLYATLHLFGYDLSLDEIRRFRQLGSKTAGHPEYGHAPGVEMTTGPLGQGFAHGVGMALAARMTAARFARDGEGPGHHAIYGIVSDGDLMEGLSAEAASLAGHLRLGNLVYVYDDNRITIDGTTALAFTEDVAKRFEAQRWHVQRCDGEDAEGLGRALTAARSETDRPSIVLLRTTIGFGSPNKANTSKVHGAPLGPEETKLSKQALGWPTEPPFHVPDDVRAWATERAAAKRAERQAEDAKLAAWREAHSPLAAQWDVVRAKHLPPDFAAKLAAGLESKDAATRQHSGAVLQRIAEAAPWVVGGSADLAESNLTRLEHGGDVGPAAGEGADPFAGRNVHFGIREHAMAALVNGINLDGTLRAFGATFLVFSDYMRPSIRLAALMGVPSVFVFTHDSIFLGEDGPTHQPIEHLDSLRSIPGLVLFRPADGVETAAAWAYCVQQAKGPTVLALTRQKLPALQRPGSFALDEVWKGAYVLREASSAPRAVLMASGSEVSLALEAATRLESEGIAVRVVSAPCLELFAARPEAERRRVLGDDVPVIAVEAARGASFWPFVGARGVIHGIDRFGASAPIADLAREFGFTPEALAARVKQQLARTA